MNYIFLGVMNYTRWFALIKVNYTRWFALIKVNVKIGYIQAFISFQIIGFCHILLHPNKSNNFEKNVSKPRTISHINYCNITLQWLWK